MDLIVNYLFESAIILGLLTAFYRLVLHAEPTFKFNRFYLLLSLLVATIAPILTFVVYRTIAPEGEVYVGNVIEAITVYAQNTKAVVVPVVAQSSAFKWLYIVGCIGLLVRLLFGFIRLGGLAGKVKLVSYEGYKVADLPGQFNPFSFFHVVFVNQSRYSDKELEQIMIHELTHVKLKHSWDVLLLEVLLIVQWFNPFAWFLRSLLKELHEFQADKQVLKKGYSAKSYKELLLFQATGTRLLPVNNFNQSLTKKRFTMMKKDKIQKLFSLKSVFSIVTISMVAVLFACELRDVEPEMTQEEAEIKEAIENTNAQLKASGPVFFVVEEMPEFPKGEFEKGEQALRMFIATGVKYPLEAQAAGAFGRAYISFIVADDGYVRDVKVARSSGHSILDDEAVRVVSSMPQWIPGKQRGKAVNVSYTVPINFSLNGGDDIKQQREKNKKKYTPEEQAQMIKANKEKGVDIIFNDDGSIASIVVDKNGKATPVASN
ncbi:M56 family metallopeptidase [Carboxylicivirga marina]|uniref:M56 family metallopeptidase n=1 Tax=Carboxylicivirga marina TaxID=2800988 RepID=A0ABS1HE33_9BACT|nr:M56 family metallopeptidase [Carboxylicivirga marina]MBK3515919.1 M56 family metallopeptidase [Carboxylicivirga marina]